MERLVWVWVWIRVAKGMWENWHMTPMQQFDKVLQRAYMDPIIEQLNQRPLLDLKHV